MTRTKKISPSLLVPNLDLLCARAKMIRTMVCQLAPDLCVQAQALEDLICATDAAAGGGEAVKPPPTLLAPPTPPPAAKPPPVSPAPPPPAGGWWADVTQIGEIDNEGETHVQWQPILRPAGSAGLLITSTPLHEYINGPFPDQASLVEAMTGYFGTPPGVTGVYPDYSYGE